MAEVLRTAGKLYDMRIENVSKDSLKCVGELSSCTIEKRTQESTNEEPEVVETQPFDEAKLDCSSTLSKPKDITLEEIVESEDVYDPVFSKIATIFLTSGYQGYVISNIDMNEKFHYNLGYIEEKETIKLEDDENTSDDEESENLSRELDLFKQKAQRISVCHDLSDFRNKFKDEPHSKDIYIEPEPFSLKSQTLNVEDEENFSQKDFDNIENGILDEYEALRIEPDLSVESDYDTFITDIDVEMEDDFDVHINSYMDEEMVEGIQEEIPEQDPFSKIKEPEFKKFDFWKDAFPENWKLGKLNRKD